MAEIDCAAMGLISDPLPASLEMLAENDCAVDLSRRLGSGFFSAEM